LNSSGRKLVVGEVVNPEDYDPEQVGVEKII
jgi:hypothetical protein